tara:strand:+ start:314 stop:790 length:477 start_codon:yes stop_codon:yes gene_type:complete
MKKFTIFFIFFYFIFNIEGNGNAKTTRLKGINEVDLLVESLSKYAEECSISYEKIETTAKYVLANSKIKISELAWTPILYIKVSVVHNGVSCSVFSKITVQTLSDKDPYDFGNRGAFLYYQNDRIATGGIKSSIANLVIEQIEEMMKELVVKHHEDNQ